MRAYHDREWGVPAHDDRKHFELLTLEGAQAGLSWLVVLRRRDSYREAFSGLDPAVVANFGEVEMAGLLANHKLIRNRAKLSSVVTNARAFLRLQAEFGSFDQFVWRLVGGRPLLNCWDSAGQVPAWTDLSRRMSLELRQRGFSFCGPTICYSHLQSAGLVQDHLTSCFRWAELSETVG